MSTDGMKTEVSNHDLTTKDGWETFLRSQAEIMATAATEKEVPLAGCTLVVTRHPITGAAYPYPSLCVLLTHFHGADTEEADANKDAWTMIVRTVAVAGGAIAAVASSEAWMSTVSPEAAADPNRPRPMNDPNRKEILVLMCEHREFGECQMISIIENKDGQRVIGPWETRIGRNFGDMGRFVAPAMISDDPLMVRAARMYLETKKDMLQMLWSKDHEEPS